ncbi:hypothetical protein R3W88_010659 [Solanum pinnatisectum]|uniref:Uncharacterized protein n=1 Tax=Solanum pinnatisectum TaxID=50273 RepID=A0AAV9L455_9SOLN|nr:hypothetical protein R3W88_010659 [Solanum pinnatisectum]
MNKRRKMCSAVFMGKKFYVIGGIGGTELSKVLFMLRRLTLSGTGKWTEIYSMSPVRARARGDMPATSEAPPLVAVVNSDLYATDYANMKVWKYGKQIKARTTIIRLPERAASMNGWSLAFRACSDRLIVIG